MRSAVSSQLHPVQRVLTSEHILHCFTTPKTRKMGEASEASDWSKSGTWNTKIDPSTVRNVFTTAFVAVNFAISFLGTYYLKRRVQRALVTQKMGTWTSVPISHLTSWLSIGSVTSYIWKVRRLPGGVLGWLMLWTGIFSLAHQYFVNSFILPQPQQSQCLFDRGIITTHRKGSLVPASTWPPALLVFNAHLAVQINGGQRAIYDKINIDTSAFRPGNSDILGYWNCTEEAGGVIAPANWSSVDALTSYVHEEGFIYTGGSYRAGALLPDGSYMGFVEWGATNDTDSGGQWILRATIANPLAGSEPLPVSNFQCELVSTSSDWTPPLMPPYESLKEWGPLIYGFIKDVGSHTYRIQLETMLNGMTMIAGSGNNANLTFPSGEEYYGCVVNGTAIGIEVFIMLFALILLFLLVLAADLFALILYRRNKNHSRVEEVPTDLLSWQLETVRSSTGNRKIEIKALRDVTYGWREETKEMGFLEKSMAVCILSFSIVPQLYYVHTKKSQEAHIPLLTVTPTTASDKRFSTNSDKRFSTVTVQET
jgi:hypothetical protein